MNKSKAMNALVMALLIVPLWIVALLNNIPWHSRPNTIVITPQGTSQTVQWSFRDQGQARAFADHAGPVIESMGGSLPRREGGTVTAKLPANRTADGSIRVSIPSELTPAGNDWALRVRLSPFHVWKADTTALSLRAVGYEVVEGLATASFEIDRSDGFLLTALLYFGGLVSLAYLCAVALAFRIKSRPEADRKALLQTFSGLSQVPATLGLAMSSVIGLFEALSIQFGTLWAGGILLASVCPVILAGIYPLRRLTRLPDGADTWASRSVALVLQATPVLLFLFVRMLVDTPLAWVTAKLALGTWGLAVSEIIVYACAVALAPFVVLRLLPLNRTTVVPNNGTQVLSDYWVLSVGDTGMANAFVVGFWPGSAQFIVTDRLLRFR